MPTSKKKRDHKLALKKRVVKLADAKARSKELAWNSITKSYAGDLKIMPMPTVVDALSTRSSKDNKNIRSGIESVTKYFNTYIKSSSSEHRLEISLPENAIGFIIPLDFYLPLPTPYNAANLVVTDASITGTNCVTIITDTAMVDDSAMKFSYLLVSVCDNEFGNQTQIKSDQLSNIFNKAVELCNAVIAAFQAIPTRHNHYMHRITDHSCPELIDTFMFARESGKVLIEEEISINGNVRSEIFQSRPLDTDEMNQFRIAHVNQVFTNDKIFDLVSRFNDAINSRCFGNNEEAILLSDSYTELAIGYIYCETQKATGRDSDEVIAEYAKFRTIGEIISPFAELIESSNTKLRKQIGFDEWYKYCRTVRNDLTHRWITEEIDSNESLQALHYSGLLISKLCAVIQSKFPKHQHSELYDKLDLLSSTSFFVSILHKDIE